LTGGNPCNILPYMTRTDILHAVQGLSLQEQFEVLESLARLLRQQCPAPPKNSADRGRLAAAAEALCADYRTDPELTAFTALDCEDFHVTR
jgi:hypothetical protein